MRTLSLRGWGRSVLALIAQSQERRAIRALQAFDNRAVADIGITRGEIALAVRHGRPSEWDGELPSTASETRVRTKACKRVPPLHVFLLLACLVPFGSLLSFGSLLADPKESSTRESSMCARGTLHNNSTKSPGLGQESE